MFGNFKNMANVMKMAGQAREKAEQLQRELEKRTVSGESGGGAVQVTLNGKGKAVHVEIDQPVLAGIAGDDKMMVEELLAAAFNAAHEKVQDLVMEETQKLTGDMDLGQLQQMLGDQTPKE